MSNTQATVTPADLSVKRIQPAYQQVADQLRDLILRGSLTPGERLPTEPDLSSTFGVSRSTIREALRILASQNLIRSARGVTGGTFVSQPEPDSISTYLEASLGLLTGEDIGLQQFLEAREILEVTAARLAAERRTDAQVAALRASLARPNAELGLAHQFEGNVRFHTIMVQAAHNPLLEVMVRPVFGVLRTRFLRDRAPDDIWQQVAEDHQDLLEAIAAQNAEAAAEAAAAHVRHLRPVYERIDRRVNADGAGGGGED